MTNLEDFKKNIERYYGAQGSLKEYEKGLGGVNAIKGLEEVLREQVDPNAEINLTAEEQQRLQRSHLLKKIVEVQEKATLDYLKNNLEGVLKETSPENLFQIIIRYPHDSRAYKKLSEAISNYKKIEGVYQTYTHFIDELKGNSSGEKDKKYPSSKDIQKYNQTLQDLIEKRIRNHGKIKDEETINELAAGLVLGGSLNYKNSILIDELKVKTNSLMEEMKDRNKVASYIKERLEKDRDYIDCATSLYNLINLKKE